jgi:hypothetical protein
LQEAKISLKHFRTMLFGASATVRNPAVPGGSPHGEAMRKPPAASSGHGAPVMPTRGAIAPGRWRQGTEAYAGAERVACHHEALRIGEVCPVCSRGRLYAVLPGVERRPDGNALLSAIRYALEQLRCSVCGAV